MATEQTKPCYFNETQTLNPEQLSHGKGFNTSLSSLKKKNILDVKGICRSTEIPIHKM